MTVVGGGGVLHPEAEHEADRRDVAGGHAVPGRGDDVRADQEAGAERADRLVAEPLGGAEVAGGAEVLRRQRRGAVAVVGDAAGAEERDHAVRVGAVEALR